MENLPIGSNLALHRYHVTAKLSIYDVCLDCKIFFGVFVFFLYLFSGRQIHMENYDEYLHSRPAFLITLFAGDKFTLPFGCTWGGGSSLPFLLLLLRPAILCAFLSLIIYTYYMYTLIGFRSFFKIIHISYPKIYFSCLLRVYHISI